MQHLITSDWRELLATEFEQEYFQKLTLFLAQEAKQGKEILPPKELIFNALNLTPFAQTQVIVLGQDPYPTKGHAQGLSFSVNPQVAPLPASLRNIFKELNSDLNLETTPTSTNGSLINWAKQGVLLINNIFTLEAGKPNSHQKQGWEIFTDKIISLLSEKKTNLVFILWGKPAQQKFQLINANKHLVLTSAHPSPLAAHRGFFGSQPFSKTNNYLKEKGLQPIDWSLEQLQDLQTNLSLFD